MSTTPYDAFAWFYNLYWGGSFVGRIMPVLDNILLANVQPGARILDLCCGTGNIANALAARGFAITGVDNSHEMLRYARENAPNVELIEADATAFTLPKSYVAAYSCFDSLNHILALDDLTAVFRNVCRALCPGGRFLFDLNMDEGFQNRWNSSQSIVGHDHVLAAKTSYDPAARLARMDITMFRLIDSLWQRTDVTHFQRAYTADEVRSALITAGFASVRFLDTEREVQLLETGRLIGRLFVLATAPAATSDCA